MDDGAQTAAGVRLHLFGERQNAIVSAEIRVQTNGARFTQRVDGGIPGAVADNNGLLPGQKMAGQGEADTTAPPVIRIGRGWMSAMGISFEFSGRVTAYPTNIHVAGTAATSKNQLMPGHGV
jgi:hypothetical protein